MHFDPSNHTYTKDNKRYAPVSDVISQLSPEFEAEKIAGFIAKRDKRTVEEVLEEWDMKSQIARDFGNAIHKSIELWIKHSAQPKNKYLQNAVKTFPLKNKGLISEKIVYDDDLQIAGTIDILRKKKSKYDLCDIKTSYDLEKSYNRLLSPLQDLKDSPLNKYRLQMSIYKQLAESMGFKIDKLFILKWAQRWEVIEVKPIEIDLTKIDLIKVEIINADLSDF
jgi:hypothetical protein